MPEGVREWTQGYQLRLERAPVLLCRFVIIGVELHEKLEETGREKEGEHGGGARLTEFASPQHCCCALFWTFIYGTYKERSPRCFIFP